MIDYRPLRLLVLSSLLALIGFMAGGNRAATRATAACSLFQNSNRTSTERNAEEVYKNIQALNGLRASEIEGAMEFMCAALGVGCTYCHVNQWESDEKTAKLSARRMILMTRAINKESFSGNPAVTCYTCHHGQHNTIPNPSADIATMKPDDAAAVPKPPALPPTNEIIDRYIRAIGGEAAIENINTRVSRGTETASGRTTAPLTSPIEICQAAGNRLLIIKHDAGGRTERGFNGVKGWIRDVREPSSLHERAGGLTGTVRILEGQSDELEELKREADLFRYLKLRETYPQMRLLGKERVAGRDAYVIGATSREDSREKLYFDAETGLLTRRYVSFKTAFGTISDVTEFSDYREVRGVKFPFTIIWSRAPYSLVRRFAEIKLNDLINVSRFEPQ